MIGWHMATQLLYLSLLAACFAFAMACGGGPERAAASIMLVGSLVSLVIAINSSHQFRHVNWGAFAVDSVAQVLFLILASKADRFWPIVVAGVHLLALMSHLARMLVSLIDPRSYQIAEVIGSYIILSLIIAGTWRHRQRRRHYGTDRSWSSSCTS